MYRIVSNDGDTWACADISGASWLLDSLLAKSQRSGVHKEVSYTVEWLDPEVCCKVCGTFLAGPKMLCSKNPGVHNV